MPIQINFLSNVRDLVRGTSNVEDALGDVSDALDDVAADSQRSARKMAASQKDAARDIDQSNERLERSFKELADSSKRSTSQVGDDLARNTRRSTEQAGESVKEFGNEAKQNISETFSSFRGDVTDFGQIVQDTLGGLASGLEGIPGIAAVAAGAAGIGLLLGALQNGQVESEQFRAEVGELAGDLIDAGNTGSRSIDQIVAKLRDLATNGDDAGVTLDKLAKLGDRTGDSVRDIAAAYTGNSKALRDHIKENTEYAQLLQSQLSKINANNDAERATAGPLTDKITALQSLNDVYRTAAARAEAAEKAAQEYADSGAAQLAAKAEQIKNIDQAYDDAAGAASDYVNAETGIFDVQKYIDAMTAKAAALDQYKTNFTKAALTLSPEAQAFIQSQGEESAAQFTAAYVAAGPDQQAQLNAVWTTAGKTSADSYVGSLRQNIPATVPGPTVVIDDVDTSRIIGQIRQTLDGHTFTVNAWANVRVGNAVG